MLPSMWRVELYHPLLVHLPIGVLSLAVFMRLFGGILLSVSNRPSARFTYAASQLLTVIGAAATWPAYITGNWAEEEVNSQLCDPTLTHLHGDLAFYVAVLFASIAAIDLLAFSLALFSRHSFSGTRGLRGWLDSRVVLIVLVLASLVGGGLLGYVGHLGASLVYQQGAGVYKPSAECTEFE